VMFGRISGTGMELVLLFTWLAKNQYLVEE
jgi:hypothetical protein